MKSLLLGAGLTCATLSVLAQPAESPADDDTVVLGTTVITATRSEEAINHLPAAMTVIEREDIEASAANHIVDLLQATGGVQISDSYGDGSRSLVGLRGFGENAHSNTLILIDGRPLNNPDIGAPELNAVSLKDVERIEILQGSAGVLYGDQAVGGVINIVTRGPLRQGESQSGFVSLRGGSYQGQRAQAGYSQRFANGVGFRISAEERFTDNFRDHNDLDYQNLLTRLDWDLGIARLFFELQNIDEELDTPGALFEAQVDADREAADPSFLGDFTNTETQVWRSGGSIDLGDQWQFISEVTNRRSRSRFRLSFLGAPETEDAFQKRNIYGLHPRFVGRIPLSHGDALVTLGADASTAWYQLQSRFGTQSNDQDTRAGYVQAIVPVGPGWTLTGGYRAARVENDLQDNSPFPVFDVYPNGRRFHETEQASELGIEYRPTVQTRVFARVDRNFRFAKLDEYFSSGATPGSGQVLLETQTGESIELGGGWFASDAEVQLSLYQLDLEDEIVFDPVTFTNINLDRTRREGAQLSGAWRPMGMLQLDAGYHYVDASVESGSFEGRDIPLVAKHSGHAGVQLAPLTDVTLRLEGRHVGERGFSGDFNNSLGDLDSFTVANLSARWQWQGFSVSGRVNNLFDAEYSEFGAKRTLFLPPTFAPQDVESFFPSPGRNFWLEIGYEFGDRI